MTYKIPTQFEVAGQTIDVKFVADLLNNEDAHGVARYRENAILLQEPNESCYLPEDKLNQVFLHEAVHWILFQMGHTHLNQDESFVEMFSGFLYQVLKSSRGELNGYGNNEPKPTEGCDSNTFIMRPAGFFSKGVCETPGCST